jgi:ribosome-interacting GTPase 1
MTEDKKTNNDMIKQIKKQNPGVKIKKTKEGGIQISNPRAPNNLLLNLIKRATK